MTNNPSKITHSQQIFWYLRTYKKMNKAGNMTCYIFKHNNEKIGYAVIKKVFGKYLITGGLKESKRGSGFGKALFREIIQKVPSSDVYLEVLDSNFIAKKLYTGLGFKSIKKTRVGKNTILTMKLIRSKQKIKQFNYENKTYLSMLNELDDNFYTKYINTVKRYAKDKKIKFLDVGCGNGSVINQLKTEGFNNLYGVDISELFVKSAKKKKLKNIYYYDGKTLPFKNSSFDIIGSFNVLEHTQEPENYLEEQIKKLKKGGVLIVACPNFFTPILKTRHRRINGFKNRVHNSFRVLNKSIRGGSDKFERIEPIVREVFEYDDDSIVVTNPIDLKKILRDKNCKIINESGFINTSSIISRVIDKMPFFIHLMPSCFIVAQMV